MTTPVVTENMLVKTLLFDAANPRLRSDDSSARSQQEIFDLLWRDFAVDEVAASIAANGFFPYEPLFVIREPAGTVVVEGNRRLAAIKAILGQMRLPAGASSVPRLIKRDRDRLETVPCVVTTREAVWQYIGFKHVNGPQAWQSASKANYIAWVHNDLSVPLEEIAARIGDRHDTVQRLYRALMVIHQAEEADVWQRSDCYKKHFSFSHLYTGLDYGGIQAYVKVKPTSDESPQPVPTSKLKELGELCLWLYGSKSRERPPLVTSQNPDLRILSDVLQSKDGIAALRRGLPLKVSLDISKGDTQLLREALVGAKESLQTARGRVLTGYQEGEGDLVVLSRDCAELAEALYEDLVDLERQRRAGRSSRRRATDRAGS